MNNSILFYMVFFLASLFYSLFTHDYTTASSVLVLGLFLFAMLQFRESKIVKRFVDIVKDGM